MLFARLLSPPRAYVEGRRQPGHTPHNYHCTAASYSNAPACSGCLTLSTLVYRQAMSCEVDGSVYPNPELRPGEVEKLAEFRAALEVCRQSHPCRDAASSEKNKGDVCNPWQNPPRPRVFQFLTTNGFSSVFSGAKQLPRPRHQTCFDSPL